jgi:hypothetical protein
LRYFELGTGILIHIPDLRKDFKEIRKEQLPKNIPSKSSTLFEGIFMLK